MSSSSRPRTKAPRSIRNRRNGGISSSKSAEIVADLDDVLLQILSFLPIKSLLRFKRVSKRWLSLITNPDFSQRLLKSKHPLPISGFFLRGTRNTEYRYVSLGGNDANNERLSLPLSIRFADHPTDMIIMQSTNGLLLCKCSCSHNQFNTSYYVYNPTTKQNTLLPLIIDPVALSLAFDPSESPHYKVFALKRRSNDTLTFTYGGLYHLEVYSSNEGPWKRVYSVAAFDVPQDIIELCQSIFWNGAVHWFGHNSREFLSFDINQEKIKFHPFPNLDHQEEEEHPDIETYRFVDGSRGNLYFIELNDLSSANLLVYEMKRYGSSWSLKHNIDLEPLAAAFPDMVRTEYYTDRQIYAFSIIGFVSEEKDADSYIVLHIPNEAVKYNFSDKTYKKLCGFEALVNDALGFPFSGYRTSFHFIKSLANV